MEKVYQEFEPVTTWTSDPDAEILIVDLPGFKKEQLKLAVSSTRKLRLTGERPTGGNKWIRFHQEIPVPLTLDIDSVSATFKFNKLYIRHPKVKKTQVPQTKPPVIMKPLDQHEKKQGQGSAGEPKGPLSSKDDEEKDKVGAKWFEKYKEATGNMVKEAKNKRHLLCNVAASISLVLLILLYARNALRSSLVWNSDE
ncbi:hypothetical protein N665_0564s0011 [Sinapis alba]|nr:hypothetical protein N665_0564s0011 [Sinapis alba]